MKLFDPCHVPIHRGVEHWNLIALRSQLDTLSAMIEADMASGGKHSGWPVADREDHPLVPVLDYLFETIEKCEAAR